VGSRSYQEPAVFLSFVDGAAGIGLGPAEQVTLAWDPNTESDLAGYKIHYGTTSRSYTSTVDVNRVTTYT